MQVSDNTRALEVIRALSDKYSRKIVLSIISTSLPVEEISKEQHIPIGTCYRRIRELVSFGIVRADKTIIQRDGKKFVCYKTSFKDASITLESGELKVDITPNRDEPDRLHNMLATNRHAEKSEQPATPSTVPLVHV